MYLLILLSILLSPILSWAACGGSTSSCGTSCIQAYDSSRDCVAAALAEVSTDNTTVQVPAGTSTWSSSITMPSGYSWVLKGAGTASTIITANTNALIVIPDMDGKTWRITGFTFNGPSGTSNAAWLIYPSSYLNNNRCSSFRIDNNIFNDCKAAQTAGCIRTGGVCYGVIDSNQFIGTLGNKMMIDVNQPDDASWSAVVDLGGSSAVYIENNYFEIAPDARYLVDGSEHNWLFTDTTSGGRFVARYNVFKNGYVSNHGTCYNSEVRGNIKMEIYNNWVYHTGLGSCGGSSCDNWNHIGTLSGTGIIANNVLEGELGSSGRYVAFGNNRSEGSCNYATACDGTNAIDENQTGLQGYKCLDQPGVIGAQGSQTSSPWYIWGNRGRTGSYTTTVTNCKTDPKGCYDEVYAAMSGNSLADPTVIDGTRFPAYHFIEDRDYFLSSHPTYTTYAYPHPLRTEAYTSGSGFSLTGGSIQ